jgi:hypothetical protein
MCKVKFIWFRGLVFVAAILAPLLLSRSQGASAGAQPARKAVVVELFTSEGCSSCPPADELLGRLESESRSDGVEVIPLGFHVDYWNFQGWTDRFSSSAYSQRQFKYAHKFRIEGPYTPQLVFDGSAQGEGNDPARAHVLIERAAQRPAAADVQMKLSGEQLQIEVNAANNLAGEVMLAYTEDNLASRISAGENNGRELRHSAVVRELRSLGRLHNGFQNTVPLKIKKEWKRNDIRVVVFVQEPDTGAIDGAATLNLKDTTAYQR